jgi:hypothetical protein
MSTVTQELTGPQQRWVEALESGEYRQSAGYLHAQGGYCCLGVACEVYRRDGNNIHMRLIYRPHTRGRTHMQYDGASGELPVDVRQYFDLGSPEGHYDSDEDATSLINDNDSMHRTFPEIAQIIRSRPDYLFASDHCFSASER